jgi:hypothetical protein
VQSATAAAEAMQPLAPELTLVEQQSEPQTQAIKPEQNKSPFKEDEHDVQHTYTLRPLAH